jgi:D-beta-D-heptose 7-phosphate kinase / D-beta-D-heptose 1-phosphate adenosyltransferase
VTGVCGAAQLRAQFTARVKIVHNARALADLIARYRRHRRRIVFTNGCFDLLHAGHTAYLNSAKALGDVLIVAVNGDASVRRLKGMNRPINTLEDRLHVLSALSCIDHLVTFDDDTPRELIRAVRPDVYVKGGDYTRDRLPEAALVESLGGTVTILPYVNDSSTTRLIERIRVATPTNAPRPPVPPAVYGEGSDARMHA